MSLRFIGTGSDINSGNVVIYGAPFDTTVAVRKGCRLGPQRIRSMSHVLEEFSLPLTAGYTAEEVCDAGDLQLHGRQIHEIIDLIADKTAAVCKSGKRIVWLGGEHTLTLAAVTAVESYYKGLTTIIFDAHADLRDEYHGEPVSHACVARRLCERINPASIVQVGVRSGTEDEVKFRRAREAVWVPLNREGVDRVMALAGDRPVYLSLDIDVVDPAHAPGTGSPEPGGPSAESLLWAVNQLAVLNIVGCDVVEVSPVHDCSDITSLLAARLVRDISIIMTGHARAKT